MKRLPRRAAAVIVVALLACVGGMSIAVAFGQSDGSPAAGPVSSYTSTVPTTTTTPLSTYTSTTPTTPASTVTTPATTTPKPRSPSRHRNVGSRRPSGSRPSLSVPSRATRRGPTHLAFTGGEPLLIGGAGVALMLGGLTLQARRRRAGTR